MARISAVIPVYNEENRLGPCLESLKGWCDEVVIVNNGSTDGTVALAGHYGCKVVEFPEKHPFMGPHRVFGIGHSTGDWLVQLDADERVPEPLGRRFRELAEEGKYAGVRVARKKIILGKWLRHGGMWRVDQLKLYRKEGLDPNHPHRAHWEPKPDGEILDLPRREEYSVMHVNFPTPTSIVTKFAGSYADGEARTLLARGKRFSAFRTIYRPVRRFLINYVYRMGFRDGVPGLIYASMLAMLEMFGEAKLFDMKASPENEERKGS